jgi:NADH-quinone oxidoreductase subunit F
MSKNLSYLAGRKGIENTLFERLSVVARQEGSPNEGQMESLCKEFLYGKANLFGTVSFYDFLKPENRGKKAYVCNGSSCLSAGKQSNVRQALHQHFKEEEIGDMCCLGRCFENSAFHISGENYSGKDIERLPHIISRALKSESHYKTGNIGKPILMHPNSTLDVQKTIFKECLSKSPDEFLREIKASGLRGRGGAGFPLAIKMESCKNSEGELKFVVCNADEGDPGAYSDMYLMEQQPFTLLFGIIIAGYIVGAEWGVIYIRAEYPASIRKIQASIDHLQDIGYLGRKILGTEVNFNIKLVSAQGAYICGEETALLSSIEGQRPEVRVRPPFPAQVGLFNKPTLVNNVETLACIPYIMQQGGQNFKNIGTPKSSGTKLVSLDGYFNVPGIYEIEMGTPLSDVIQLGGGFNKPIKAMQIGGPLGGIVPVDCVGDLTVDFESFAQHGFLLGHASIVCIPADFDMIEYLKHLFKFTAHESCGKCFPCRIGSWRGYELLDKATSSDFKIDRLLLNDLLETLELGSLCALGGGLPLPVKNVLHYFHDELSPYFKS